MATFENDYGIVKKYRWKGQWKFQSIRYNGETRCFDNKLPAIGFLTDETEPSSVIESKFLSHYFGNNPVAEQFRRR